MTPLDSQYEGMLETHLTLQLDSRSLDELREWASWHGLKLLQIELARGLVTSQPMVSRLPTPT